MVICSFYDKTYIIIPTCRSYGPSRPPHSGKVTLNELSVNGCVRRCQQCMLPDVAQAAGWELPFLGKFSRVILGVIWSLG